MADDIDVIDKVVPYVTGTLTLPLENTLALDATVSTDWLPGAYTFSNSKLLVDSATDYDLGLLLVGKVPETSTDTERLYHTYTETRPDSEQEGWLSAADPYFEERGITPPETATVGYTIAKTIDIKALWPEDEEELASTVIKLYKDSVEVDAAKYLVNTDGLWWITETYDDLPLDIYVTVLASEYTLSITRASTESDTLEGVDITDSGLESPVTEAGGGSDDGGLDLDSFNYGSDECHYIPRTLSFYSKQQAKASIYPYDVNGDIIDLPDSEFTVALVLQEARADDELDAMFPATRVGMTNEFTIDFELDVPGMYIANLMIHKPSGDETPDTLLHVTRYYVSVAPSGDYGGVVTIPEIRYHLTDTCAQQNELLDAFEYSDSDIINAIHNCVEYFNGFLGGRGQQYSAKTFPVSGRYFLKQGACAFLLRARAVILARNTIPYNAGGVTIDDQNKSKIYLELAMVFNQDWVTWCGRRQHEHTFRRGFMHLS